MNTFDQYEDYEALVAQDDATANPVNLHEFEKAVTPSTQVETPKWLWLRRTLAAILRQRPHWNFEAMYPRDAREIPAPDPLRPTTLSRQLIAHIWLLNSKH